MTLVYTSTDVAVKCVNIITVYDSDPSNMKKTFTVSLSSNDPKVLIPEDRANATVTIENSKLCLWHFNHYDHFIESKFLYLVFPPDVEPKTNKVTEGMDAIFSVIFPDAITSKSFQWQVDGEDITGEHAMMMKLTIVNVTEMEEGNYTCIVTFSISQGNITSKRAELLVCKL